MFIRLFAYFLSDKQVQKKYCQAGGEFGSAVSYIYMGECIGFKGMLKKWEMWEAEYIKRGFHALSIDDFVDYGGYGKPLNNLGVKRIKDEVPAYHAKMYRELYLGKVEPVVNISKMLESGKPVVGTYSIPSTKITKE